MGKKVQLENGSKMHLRIGKKIQLQNGNNSKWKMEKSLVRNGNENPIRKWKFKSNLKMKI